MSRETLPPAPPVSPITSLDDPRVLTILSTEHWSLLSGRSLAYNEAFTRGGMFLTFLRCPSLPSPCWLRACRSTTRGS